MTEINSQTNKKDKGLEMTPRSSTYAMPCHTIN